jgi:hypothetical protein
MRYGSEVRDPSPDQLAKAIGELKTRRGDEEHPNTSLRLGLADGRVLVLDAYTSGTVYFREYADQDDADPVKSRAARGVEFDGIEKLFKLLAEGDLVAVNTVGWKDAV